MRAADAQREVYGIEGGMVSLRDLAEEELLLALPIVPACGASESCGNAPSSPERRRDGAMRNGRSAVLQDLLKKT